MNKSWLIPVYAGLAAVFTMLVLLISDSDPTLIYFFILMPAICLASLGLLIFMALKTPKRILVSLVAAVTFFGISFAMLTTQQTIRPPLRWLLSSRRLKMEVLSQSAPANHEFKHVEWDGWGGAPIGDWTAYVVYDPDDSLASAASETNWKIYHKYAGIPCRVDSVTRLESHWYSVVLGVDEWWDRCGEASSASIRK